MINADAQPTFRLHSFNASKKSAGCVSIFPSLSRDRLTTTTEGSPVCFVLASFDYPAAIRSTWGRMADEMSGETWNLLNSPVQGQGDVGLGMLLKMTRLDDLGLGELCFQGVDF
jgi:hypothetical protein